jgi:hypothetical protein
MFISKEEKKIIFEKINGLFAHNDRLTTEIIVLKAKVKALEGKPQVVVAKKPKTIAQKAKQAEYMRRYMAKKKAAKLALEQK